MAEPREANRRGTIVIPARNEASGLRRLLPALNAAHPDLAVLVVDDGSTDETAAVCAEHGARTVRHPYGKGNGAAVKSGIRAADTDLVVLMDADGQHRPEDVGVLVETLESGYDMVVGARGWEDQANVLRGLANGFYNRLASWMVGRRIPDLTSGFRAVRRSRMHGILHLLPNGFSYPATTTMAFFRAGFSVGFVPIQTRPREGRSHLQPMQDGARFLLIIFRIGTLYSPLKIFVPVSLAFFLTGTGYYLYTFLTDHRFTNMSALLLVTAVVVFLIGLVSEQITNLLYRQEDD